MPDDRRNRVPGGTFFFTVNLLDRRSDLLVTQIHALRDAVRQVGRHAPFHIDAWVVLPDHMHRLWTLPAGDADFPVANARSRRHLESCVRPGIAITGHDQPWRTRHLAAAPADWPHWSFRRCVAKGLRPAGWLGGNGEPLETGERR